jgi:hypothetical protein
MHKTWRVSKPPCAARQKKHPALALVLASCIFPGGASAQWVVSDPLLETQKAASNITQATQLAKQLLQYEQQIQQYATQLEQLRNIFTKIQSLGSGISLVPKSLDPISQEQSDELVEQACPGAPSGGIVGGIISSLESSSSRPITERQQLICKEIVLLQIDEFNVTADALGQLTVQASTVQKLNDVVNAISTLGESDSATSQAQGYMAQLQTASMAWKGQIDADNAMIETLEKQQGLLAKVAMNGNNTVLGNVVQAVALKAAFTVNE